MSIDLKQMEVGSVPKQTVVHDGIEIAYWVHGEGAPLLILTGLATAAASWGPLPALLGSQGYKTIVVENRDAGFSGRATSDYAMSDMAADAVAVLDAVGVDKSYVLGISLGGMIAQQLTIDHPDRVERLVLISTDPGIPLRVSATTEWWISFFSLPSDDPETYMKALLATITAPGFAEKNPALVAEMVRRRLTGRMPDLSAFNRQFGATATFSAEEGLKRIKVPTLIIHGELDPMVPFDNAKKIDSLIPNSELVAIPGAGHLVPLEAPGETIGALMRFLPTHVEAR